MISEDKSVISPSGSEAPRIAEDAAQAALTSAKSSPKAKEKEKVLAAPPPTRGETAFNIANWWGIGWMVNMLSSFWLADKATKLEWQPRLNWLTHKVVKQWPLRSDVAAEGSEHVKQFNKIAEAILKEPEHQARAADIAWETKTLEATGVEAQEGFRGLFNRIGKAADVHKYVQGHPELKTQFAESTVKDIETIMKAGFRYHTAYGKAKSVAGLMMLCGGGYLVMAPVKWLEDSKKDIVCWLDKKIGPSTPDAKTKEQIEARHDFLAHEPKQTWASVLLSRTAVMPLIYTVHFNMGSRDNIINRIGYKFGRKDRIYDGFDHTSNELGKTIFNHLNNHENPSVRNWVQKTEQRLGSKVPQVEAVIHAKAAHGHEFSEEVIREGYYKTAGKPTDSPAERISKEGRDRLQGIVNNVFLESLYSFSVATTTFLFSRVFGPMFGVKSEEQKTLERMQESQKIETALEKCPLPAPANDEKIISEASVDIANRVLGDAEKNIRHLPANANKRTDDVPTHLISHAAQVDALQSADKQAHIS